jgi:hypothetical protein
MLNMTSTLVLLIRAGFARAVLYVVLVAAAWVGTVGLTLPADVPVHDRGQVGTLTYAQPLDETPGRNIFRADAQLDASAIDDQRTTGVPSWAEILLLPEGSAIETTPMVPVPGTRYVVPDESPDGGYVLRPVAWLDNSPLYSDGWLLRVDGERDTVSWRAPQEDTATPVRVVNVAHATATDRPARLSRQCVKAARNILHASLSRHLRVLEDLSYRGSPRRVGQCNDLIATAYYADGRDFIGGRHDHRALRTFLRTVIRTGALPAERVNHPHTV